MKLLFFPFLHYNRAELRQRLAGKTVLLTGASYGIGEALAEALAPTQAHLLLVARTEAKLREVQQRVEAQGGVATVLPCNLAQRDQVQALAAQLAAWPNGIDLVVNNAGHSIRRSIFASLERMHDFERTMELNYYAPVQLLLALIPGLVARQGQIINISAINVLLLPPPHWAAYQASKTAFDQWLRCVGPELQRRGVKTSSIYLPLVRTRMILPTKAYRHMPAMQPHQVAALICRAIIAQRRTYTPWWILPAQLAALLLREPWEAWLGRRR
ncbi:SDR family NAD(P)-dependent oxidoreductase [Candidatus Viridilinea mediisalina]|uniref:Epimerase n=1 Tax=Candidatus Viridilinea mediisalina TaxID=2024553 RepID=A0A2A6REZ8_9CHLR|nr:SDR family NAD(P)-dependent oxidoreductase [Candidatus Viridilinea mediisalina]PDW01657.1 epimerase [Candidatus Viridilinea mediisalina]